MKRFVQSILVGIGLHFFAIASYLAAPIRISRDNNVRTFLEHSRVRFILRHAYAQFRFGIALPGSIFPIGEPVLVVRNCLYGNVTAVGQFDRPHTGIPHDLNFTVRVYAREQAIDSDADLIFLRYIHRANNSVAVGNKLEIRFIGAHKHV